jgi:hypothetical protein
MRRNTDLASFGIRYPWSWTFLNQLALPGAARNPNRQPGACISEIDSNMAARPGWMISSKTTIPERQQTTGHFRNALTTLGQLNRQVPLQLHRGNESSYSEN